MVPKTYVPENKNNKEYVECSHTKKGYMTRATFMEIITQIFIPYVKRKRERLGLASDAPAALVVDGHSSRYYPPVLEALRENNIALLIIPAHSSHLIQPLDLILNKQVKEQYKGEWSLAVKAVLTEMAVEMMAQTQTTELGTENDRPDEPPTKRARTNSKTCSVPEQDRPAEGSKIKKANYLTPEMERIATVRAAENAVVSALLPRNIQAAWKTSSLFP